MKKKNYIALENTMDHYKQSIFSSTFLFKGAIKINLKHLSVAMKTITTTLLMCLVLEWDYRITITPTPR